MQQPTVEEREWEVGMPKGARRKEENVQWNEEARDENRWQRIKVNTCERSL